MRSSRSLLPKSADLDVCNYISDVLLARRMYTRESKYGLCMHFIFVEARMRSLAVVLPGMLRMHAMNVSKVTKAGSNTN